MTGTKYLSELVDISLFQRYALNIIKAPTGSGKTYFALEYIPSLVDDAVHNVVYLIDTINGKEQIIKNYNAISEYYTWSSDIDTNGMWFDPDGRIVVLTYAKFGYLLEKYPGFYTKFTYIICDELHNLLKFQNYSRRPNYHSIAKTQLENAVNFASATVIALTATPNALYNQFNAQVFEIPINQDDLIHYETNNTVGYADLNDVLLKVSPCSVGVCYLSRISQMISFCDTAQKQGYSPIAIWSTQNTDHPMTEEQLSAREMILTEYKIPSQYNLLIINSSCETSIKIKSPVNYVAIHSSNIDTQIQVRGRVNSDLDTLFLPSDTTPVLNVPERYLGTMLFTKDKNELLKELDLRNQNNRRCGWATVKKYLSDNDYTVFESRKNNKRYSIITKN